MRLHLLLLALPFLAGCGTIYSVEPFGSEIAVLEPKRVDGLWLTTTGQLIGAKVVDAENGVVTTWLAKNSPHLANQFPLRCEPPSESTPSCTFKNQVGTCLFDARNSTCTSNAVATCAWRRDGTAYFPVVRDPQKDAYATQFLLYVSGFRWNGAPIGWPRALVLIVRGKGPGADRLKNLIQEGKLPRNLDNPKAPILGPLSAKHYDLIFDRPSRDLDLIPFSFWEDALSLTKLPDDIDPCKKGSADK